jgi:hypothetical protein
MFGVPAAPWTTRITRGFKHKTKKNTSDTTRTTRGFKHKTKKNTSDTTRAKVSSKDKGVLQIRPGVYKFKGSSGYWFPPRRSCGCGG